MDMWRSTPFALLSALDDGGGTIVVGFICALDITDLGYGGHVSLSLTPFTSTLTRFCLHDIVSPTVSVCTNNLL